MDEYSLDASCRDTLPIRPNIKYVWFRHHLEKNRVGRKRLFFEDFFFLEDSDLLVLEKNK